MTGKILAFAGSTRTDSYNRRLLALAVEAVKAAGGAATFIDLRDYPLPLYDADAEAASGLPANAKKLKALFAEHQGLLIASPEYNGSVTGVLKNMLDWVSRGATKDEPPYASYAGKIAGVMAASPGGFGGVRAIPPLRHILNALQVTVLHDQITISAAHNAFGEDGKLKDQGQMAALDRLARRLVDAVKG